MRSGCGTPTIHCTSLRGSRPAFCSARATSYWLMLTSAPARATSAPHARTRASRLFETMNDPPGLVAVAISGPRRDLAVDPLLQLDDERAEHGERHEIGEDFLRLHHLPGLHEEVPHAALTRAADHLGCDDEDYGDAHAEVQAGEGA